MPRNFEVIFFDLGNTLIYSRLPWPDILAEADQALVDALHRQGCMVDRQVFIEEFVADLRDYYRERDVDQIEFTTEYILQHLLHEFGFGLPAAQVRAALNAMYAVTQANWFLEEDALPMLKTLQGQGYRLGLISNASDGEDVRTLLANHGLTQYFDPVLISAEVGMRKPHPHIFKIALTLCNTPPENTVMVGDTLEADILGANNAGMTSVWVTRRASPDTNHADIQPDASAAALIELPDILTSLAAHR